MIFTQTTESVNVRILPKYYSEGAARQQDTFIWHYSVKIENLGLSSVQVLGRHWHIFAANGKFQEVSGLGLIGYQPIIRPGEHFSYTSEVLLFTDSGLMYGEYHAVNLGNKRRFSINIPPFSLEIPEQNFNNKS